MAVSELEVIKGRRYFIKGFCIRHGQECVCEAMVDTKLSHTFATKWVNNESNYHQFGYDEVTELIALKSINKDYLNRLDKNY